MNRPRAFTLVEILITMTIFSMVAILIVDMLVNSLRSEKKIQAQAFLFAEGELIMDQLTREIEQNTIDYEAYYLRNVQGETGWETQNYGYYGQSFYDPGSDGWYGGPYSSLADYYGVNCSAGGVYPDDCPTETPDYADLDLNTGTHPFTGIGSPYTDDATTMNAFCENQSADCNALEYAVTDELILINGAGDQRTIFVKELFDSSSSEFRLSGVKLTGSDSDADGLVDAWVCAGDYTCTGTDSTPDAGDLIDTDPSTATDFMPFTPGTINILDFLVFITPMEDPYRAFAEVEVQVQPQVTLLLTITLSEDYGINFLGDTPTVTLKRSSSTNVYGEVVSYE